MKSKLFTLCVLFIVLLALVIGETPAIKDAMSGIITSSRCGDEKSSNVNFRLLNLKNGLIFI